jgi:hypothetical protein
MASNKYKKDPDSLLDYTIDWSSFLGTDTIASSEWLIDEEITKEVDYHTNTTTTLWCSGGNIGEEHSATCRITTAGGRIEDQTIIFKIVEK